MGSVKHKGQGRKKKETHTQGTMNERFKASIRRSEEEEEERDGGVTCSFWSALDLLGRKILCEDGAREDILHFVPTIHHSLQQSRWAIPLSQLHDKVQVVDFLPTLWGGGGVLVP